MAPLKIAIPTTHTHEGSKPYTEYEIRISHPFPRTTTTLRKRYSDFDALDSSLRSHVGSTPPHPLPPKSWLGGSLGKLGFGSTSTSPELIAQRREGLEQYLKAIEESDDGRWRLCPAYRTFLGLDEHNEAKAHATFPGSQFGRDRVHDPGDWLDKMDEARSSIQEARLWLVRREQATNASSQHEASANAKKGLVRTGTLLAALEEALNRFDEEKSGLGKGEIRRRRDNINVTRKERDSLEGVLNTMAVKAAVSASGASTPSGSAVATQEQKAGLFKGSNPNPGRRVLGAAKETERTRELDNEGVLQLQKQIMAEQDEDVGALTKVIMRMKDMGLEINAEVIRQNEELGMMEEDTDRLDAKIKLAKKRADQIR
ncbi:Phox-like protein [Polyplosphaeria fusca]|uniref:Phox-like protein n=1 Tax=Polyplosphaeria fusca TaxID=682080 RepID=A0A9P4QNM0_9PLEO|nr:Phox-like protein [Polyplosphaeria fusca]